jgi:transcriptional regulator with XRE-family HTH domain
MAVLEDRRHMVGERLAELREQKALTLRDLEEASGVGADAISKIENGHRKPRPSTLRKLARALGVEVEDFFRQPAVPLADAPRGAGHPSAAERADSIEGLAASVESVAERAQARIERTGSGDGDAWLALLEDTSFARKGAEQLLEEVADAAMQQPRETPGERRARSRLEDAVIRLDDLAESIASKLLEGTEELEWAEEFGKLLHFDKDLHRRRAG